MKTFKTQLDPSNDQIETFKHWAKVRRGVYNWGRSVRQAAWERQGKNLSHYDLDKLATEKKTHSGFEHWGDPPRRVLYFALRDVDSAFQHFFRRVENGETPGYPQRDYGDTRRFTVYGSDVKIRGDGVRLPKMGWVRLEEKGYLPKEDQVEKLSEVTVSQDGKRWHVAVQAHVESPIDSSRLRSEDTRPDLLAVHPGVRQWLALMTGQKEETRLSLPMDRLIELESRIDRQHRALSRRQSGSNGWERAQQSLATTYRKKRNLLDDRIHKATAQICYNIRPRRLIIQDWSTADMMEMGVEGVPRKVQRRINRRMAAAQFGKIRRQLEYKAEWAGIEIEMIPEEVPVSQRCSQCGYMNGHLEGQKMLRCRGCGRTVERETNALENYILQEHDRVAQG